MTKKSNLLYALAACLGLTLAMPVFAVDESFTIEFMWGIGDSAAKDEGTNSKFCKNRSWAGLKGIGFRYVKDNVEMHVSRYV